MRRIPYWVLMSTKSLCSRSVNRCCFWFALVRDLGIKERDREREHAHVLHFREVLMLWLGLDYWLIIVKVMWG